MADIVLLFQCFYYNRINLRNPCPEAEGLINPAVGEPPITVDGSHLSPATPLIDPIKGSLPKEPQALWKSILFNGVTTLTVCLAGVLGWWISSIYSGGGDPQPPQDGNGEGELAFSLLGQIFGYLCAILYLASRLPQILLNYRRQSCEGISLLFFLFACIGNLTYVLSILSHVPSSKKLAPGEEYRRYIAVNASWLLGSVGTLFLDLVIFGQFFWYRDIDEDYETSSTEDEDEREGEGEGEEDT